MKGKVFIGLVIQFAAVLAGSEPSFEFNYENVTAKEGSMVEIVCKADGDKPMLYQWFRYDEDISEGIHSFIFISHSENASSLMIRSLGSSHSGVYICKASNQHGLASKVYELVVLSSSSTRPNIVKFNNLISDEGKEAVFECLGEGDPKPEMTIRRDNSNEDIKNNPKEGIELDVSDDGGFKRLRLKITNVKRTDDGLYFCKASNEAGVEERTGHLQVRFSPDMRRTPATPIKTWNGNPVNLSCIVDAIPNATITWTFQGEPIELPDERYQIFGEVSYSNLLVMTENREHYEVFGIYQCEARNELGENSARITLDEAVRPGPITQIVFDKVTSTRVTFRLMGPGNNGGMLITHYIMKYRLHEQEEDPFKEITWEKDARYIVTHLTPRAKYQFSAAAINVVGVGDFKDVIYIMPEETVPEPPIIKTRQETVSEYPDRFEVLWDVPEDDNGKPILKYIIRYFKVERNLKDWTQIGSAVEIIVSANNTSFQVEGLMPNSYYEIQIRATNELGNSLPASVVIKTGKGNETSSILNVRVSNVTSNSVLFRINISAPASFIEVKYNESRDSTEYTKKWHNDNNYEVTDLIPGGLYSFRFRTEEDDWSEAYEVTLLPDSPEVILQNLENGNVKLQWHRTIEDIMRSTTDRYQLTYYTVQMVRGSTWAPSNCAITIQIPTCAGTSYTISGLSKEVFYEIQLRAHTSSGYGEPYKQKFFFPR